MALDYSGKWPSSLRYRLGGHRFSTEEQAHVFFASDFRARQQVSYLRINFHLFSLTECEQTSDNPRTPSWAVWESFPSHWGFLCNKV